MKSHHPHPHPRDIDPFDTFVWMMWHLYRPDSLKYMAALTGYPRRKLGLAVRSHLKPTAAWAREQVYFLKPEEWVEISSPQCIVTLKRIFYYADGTVFDIFQPSDRPYARQTFSNKHETNGLNVFLVVADNGRIVYASDVFPGNKTDHYTWKKSKVGDSLSEFYNNFDWPYSRTVEETEYQLRPAMGGDKGYVLATPPAGWPFVITQSGAQVLEQEGTAAPEGIEFSPKLAPFRSLVERVIQRVKSYRGLLNKYNMALKGQFASWAMMWTIACGLVNWRLGLAAPAEDESDGE